MKLDILAFGAHPDDVEISASGTIAKHVKGGKTAGIVDLTRGELGTRGNADLRLEEAKQSAKILGLAARENLGLADGFFMNDKQSQLALVQVIRKYQPDIVLANAVTDRHPDHGKAAKLVSDACFLSGLIKVETELDGEKQKAWRPSAIYHYIQDRDIKPDFVVDISDYIDFKVNSIKAFKSQFYDPDSKEPETAISSKKFLDSIKERPAELGRSIGVSYAEGFTVERNLGVNDLFDLI
ncbi:MAG: bacillithiol biosynthesis deacetylase BshB1 [Bacteroidia bacterium]|nr:bacillithiol biosynthesis deacetylase BshB1 [Bacteroidia bacterium]